VKLFEKISILIPLLLIKMLFVYMNYTDRELIS